MMKPIAWYNETSIHSMLEREIYYCQALLEKRLGNTIAFLSAYFAKDLKVHHRYKETVVITDQVSVWDPHVINARYDELPLRSEFLDCMVVQHIFDFSDESEAVIEEIWRTLAPRGKVIVFGFNPHPLFLMSKPIKKLAKENHCNKPASHYMLRSKFMHKGFELRNFATLIHHPVTANKKWFKRLNFLNIVGQFCWPDLGAIYCYEFQKVVVPLSLQKQPAYKRRYKLSPAGLVGGPTA